MQPLQAKPKKMVRAEPTNNRTAGIDTNHSTVFTLLLKLNVMCEQRWIQFELQNGPWRALRLMAKYTLPFSKPVKSDHNSNFWYFQNNHIKTTKFFSVRSSHDPPILKKIAVRSSPDPAKIGFSPGPVRSSPDPCSTLNNTHVARTSRNKMSTTWDFYHCLVPQCEALRACCSTFPITTK